jgi:hypothetical protein
MRGTKRNTYKTSGENREEIIQTRMFVRRIILLQVKDSTFWNRRPVYFFKFKFASNCGEWCLADRRIHCSENIE